MSDNKVKKAVGVFMPAFGLPTQKAVFFSTTDLGCFLPKYKIVVVLPSIYGNGPTLTHRGSLL